MVFPGAGSFPKRKLSKWSGGGTRPMGGMVPAVYTVNQIFCNGGTPWHSESVDQFNSLTRHSNF